MLIIETVLLTIHIHLLTLLVPGADVAIVTSSGLNKSKHYTYKIVLGIVIGTITLTGTAMVAFLYTKMFSDIALNAIKFIGACFLLYMSFSSIWFDLINESNKTKSIKKRPNNPIILGFLTEVTNPEAIFLFMSVFSMIHKMGGSVFHVILSGITIIFMTGLYYGLLAFLISLRILKQYSSRYRKITVTISAIVYLILAFSVLYSIFKSY